MANINVFMMGGRRCGKTTTLALIKENFNQVLHHDVNEGNDLLRLTADPGKIVSLDDAKNALDHYFSDDYDPFTEFVVDDNRSVDITETVLRVSPVNGGESLNITFRDIPGEWFSEPEYEEHIKAWIQEAQVLILAIDTPSLFAENGYYAEYYNRIMHISEHLKGALSGDFMNSPLSDKLLLFVPLKGEMKMFENKDGKKEDRDGKPHENGMKEITQKVKEHYADLIHHFQIGVFREKMTMAVLPISTIPEMRWKRFGCKIDGQEASIFKENGQPRRFNLHFDPNNHPYSIYTFRSPELYYRAARNGSTPYYCEQPLIYTICYMLRLVTLNKTHKQGFWDTILNKLKKILFPVFKVFDDNKAYDEELNRLSTKKMRRQNGFEIIQNPLGI